MKTLSVAECGYKNVFAIENGHYRYSFDEYGALTITRKISNNWEQQMTVGVIEIDEFIEFLKEAQTWLKECEVVRELKGC